jgi:hypothetical protein
VNSGAKPSCNEIGWVRVEQHGFFSSSRRLRRLALGISLAGAGGMLIESGALLWALLGL